MFKKWSIGEKAIGLGIGAVIAYGLYKTFSPFPQGQVTTGLVGVGTGFIPPQYRTLPQYLDEQQHQYRGAVQYQGAVQNAPRNARQRILFRS